MKDAEEDVDGDGDGDLDIEKGDGEGRRDKGKGRRRDEVLEVGREVKREKQGNRRKEFKVKVRSVSAVTGVE